MGLQAMCGDCPNAGLGYLGDDTTSVAADLTTLLAPLAQAGGNVITAGAMPAGTSYVVNPVTGTVTQAVPYGTAVAQTSASSSTTLLLLLAAAGVAVMLMMQRRGGEGRY
jgi:hypothetical protein